MTGDKQCRPAVTIAVSALLVLGVSGCSGLGVGRSGETSVGDGGGGPLPGLREISNLTYSGIQDEPVRLTDGRWEGEPFAPGGASRPSVWLVENSLEIGDLDGDPDSEAAVCLGQSSGGSGELIFLAALDRRQGTLVDAGTALIGDRVKVQAIRITDRRIDVDLVQAGPDDPACCPTQKAVRTWELRGNELIEVSSRVTGVLSATDLVGPTWVLERMSWGEPVPTGTIITLSVEDDGIKGSAGCNSYFADLVEGSPGTIRIGEIGSTRKACPPPVMELEDRYLSALRNVSSYQFLMGKLAMTYEIEERAGALVFVIGSESGR